MATYYTNSNNQRDVPMIYLPETAVVPGNMMYMASGGQMSGVSCTTDLEVLGIADMVSRSRYLKTTQQLLDEVVNVQNGLKQSDDEKKQQVHDRGIKELEEEDGRSKSSQEHGDSTRNEVSNAERQDLRNKLTKLLSMLEKVDRRYKQYYHQMQIVAASFDAIAGCGAAKPYTALALQTISRHFRCLRDALSTQISATRKSLGEQDSSDNKSVGITRLRYIDQQLRQQRALQTFGMMQHHAWRPQRGLPESSVSILRAWLFEHFLHPYPKDSDKIMLARQTGLTRGQVSNWFINARVRLWKPMVEEMYKEEFADVEIDSNSLQNMTNAMKDNFLPEDRSEDIQQSRSSTGRERCSIVDRTDPEHNHVLDVAMVGLTAGPTYQNSTRGETETETDYELLKLGEVPRHCIDDTDMFLDTMVYTDRSRDRFIAAYDMSEMGQFESGSGVSLTLGLQYYDGVGLRIPDGTDHSFDAIYNVAASSSIDTDTTNFECLNPGSAFAPSYYTTLSLEK